eukprot:TRINITY_DN4251_c0_g2_i1.p1 TRINITY_DN4251_c0_g2~~TRINITY_DN4251_c0_g2_i1.p1  ORF type:complete len:734 (-),score=150.77 TRINITY_DN4251_c0_g2_i1:19-2220(-)
MGDYEYQEEEYEYEYEYPEEQQDDYQEDNEQPNEEEDNTTYQYEEDPTYGEHGEDYDQFDEKDLDQFKLQPYKVWSESDIVAQQTEIISKTAEFLNVSFGSARQLLKYKRWNHEELYLEFSDNPAKVCAASGVSTERGQEVFSKKTSGNCLVCMEDSDEITILSCGHGYCYDCWKQYLGLQIKEQNTKILCPGLKCGRILDEFIISQLCGDEKTRSRFNKSLAESFVNDNSSIKWCPAPNCKYAIVLEEFNSQQNESVICKCGYAFCFRCLEIAHNPSFCKQFSDWKKKNVGGDESLNIKFLETISKRCPNCNNAIEKNGGCNHMCCQNCKFHFCWQCMGKFGAGPLGDSSGYSTHKCNKFSVEDNQLKSTNAKDWERFRWYSERYHNHEKSSVFETKFSSTILEFREELIKHGMSWSESSFYVDALSTLLSARHVLKGSYIFGFYRPTDCPHIHKELFEHLQRGLENHTEQLAQYLDGEDRIFKAITMKADILKATKLVEISYKGLLDVAINAIVSVKSHRPPPRPIDKRDKEQMATLKAMKASKKEREEELNAELQHVLALSKLDVQQFEEDDDLQKAIALSMMECVDPGLTKPSNSKTSNYIPTISTVFSKNASSNSKTSTSSKPKQEPQPVSPPNPKTHPPVLSYSTQTKPTSSTKATSKGTGTNTSTTTTSTSTSTSKTSNKQPSTNPPKSKPSATTSKTTKTTPTPTTTTTTSSKPATTKPGKGWFF